MYYVGPPKHLCELAWYQGRYSSHDLTAMCGWHCSSTSLPMLNSHLTGFASVGGQLVVYLGNNHPIYQMLVSQSGFSNPDLTDKCGWKPAVTDSLTSFSNASGPQVFYTDIYQHVHQITHRNPIKHLVNRILRFFLLHRWPCSPSTCRKSYHPFLWWVTRVMFMKIFHYTSGTRTKPTLKRLASGLSRNWLSGSPLFYEGVD